MALTLTLTALAAFLLVDFFAESTILLTAELFFFAVKYPAFLLPSLIAATFCIVYLFSASYPALVAAQALSFILGLILFFRYNHGHGPLFFSFVCFALAVCLFVTAVTPYPFLLLLRGKEGTMPEVKSEYYICKRDVVYDSAYPHNKFDLYTAPEATSDPRPVFLFIHGGGFCGGDKGKITSGVPYVLQKLTETGFAVVSANYAKAPEFTYPTPLLQLTELVQFLKGHARDYNIDMERVVLGGESSGGQVMGQFAAMQTNPEYAADMGIPSVLKKGEIKAIYFGCALFDCARFSHTGLSIIADYPLFQMGRGYFHTNSPLHNADIEQANVFTHITADFPDVYITDGNFATFNKQAREMTEALDDLGIKYRAFLHDEKGARFLPHGYDLYDGAESRKNAENLTDFLLERVPFDKADKK